MDTTIASASIIRSVSTCYAILDFVKCWHALTAVQIANMMLSYGAGCTLTHAHPMNIVCQHVAATAAGGCNGGRFDVVNEWGGFATLKGVPPRACVIQHTVDTRSKKINRSKINDNGSCSDVIVYEKHCGSRLSPARVCQRDRNLLRVDKPARDCTWGAVTFECNPDTYGSAEQYNGIQSHEKHVSLHRRTRA